MRDNEDQFEKKLFKGFIWAWVACGIVALGVAGVGIWALIQLVNWVTSL